VGVGIWHPDNPTLTRIRDHLVTDPARWRRAVGGQKFRGRYLVTGDSLKRAPRGSCRGYFSQRFAADCQAGSPLVKFICEALGVGF